MITVKILSLGAAERYAVRRLVTAASLDLQPLLPDLQVRLEEVDQAHEIGRFSPVLILPTLVINDRVVCSGRFPSRSEIAIWLQEAAV